MDRIGGEKPRKAAGRRTGENRREGQRVKAFHRPMFPYCSDSCNPSRLSFRWLGFARTGPSAVGREAAPTDNGGRAVAARPYPRVSSGPLPKDQFHQALGSLPLRSCIALSRITMALSTGFLIAANGMIAGPALRVIPRRDVEGFRACSGDKPRCNRWRIVGALIPSSTAQSLSVSVRPLYGISGL